MSDESLFDAFDSCLTRLKAGESIADCLSTYPGLEAELRPMLDAAQAALGVSRVPRTAQLRSRAKFLTAAGELKPRPVAAGWWRGLSTALALAAVAVIAWLGYQVVDNTVLNPSTPTSTPLVTVTQTQTLAPSLTAIPTQTTSTQTATPSPTVTATLTVTRPPVTATSTQTPTAVVVPTQMVITQPVSPTDDHGGGDDDGGDDDNSGPGGGGDEDNSGSGGGDDD